jgi:hypothetical protein
MKTIQEVWIPAFAGMTVKGSLLKVVTPEKAGVQSLIRDEVKCCSNHETVNISLVAVFIQAKPF